MGLVLAGSILACCFLPLEAWGQIAPIDTVRQLRDVNVKARRVTTPVRTMADGTRRWSLSSMHELPQILGNTDVLHMAEMLPGVQTTSEYDSGIHIWGCDNAHNEVSIDGTVLYGVQHLFGLFSVFNGAHFEALTFAPTASLASNGNHLGGLLRMESFQQVPTHATGEVSVGPISSQATWRLPLGVHTALFASVRESYLNLFYSRLLEFDDEQLRYSFGDYNLTLLHVPSERDRLRFHFYAGHDHAGFDAKFYQAKTKLTWGNIMASVDYRHVFGEYTTWKQSISLSHFSNCLRLNQQELELELPSNVLDIGYHSQLEWQRWRFGIDASFQRLRPQSPTLNGTFHNDEEAVALQQVQQVNVHAAYSLPLTNRLLLTPAWKSVLFADDNHQLHHLPAPSLTVEWESPMMGIWNLHYAWQQQPLFQTGMTSLGLPVEFWFAAGKYSSPQYAHHISLSHKLITGDWELSTSLYYKRLFNQVEYVGNIFDFINTNYRLEHSLLRGEGENYGINVMLARRTGPVTGWVSYSYGRSTRWFDNSLYSGRYPSNHERPHELNAVLNCHFSKHWSVGGTFVYSSGTPFTPLEYIYLINHTLLVQQGRHNSGRLNAYRRLDLSVNYDFKHTERYEYGLNFSLYNALGLTNELYYRLRVYDNAFSYRSKSFIIDRLPSVSFYYKWK